MFKKLAKLFKKTEEEKQEVREEIEKALEETEETEPIKIVDDVLERVLKPEEELSLQEELLDVEVVEPEETIEIGKYVIADTGLNEEHDAELAKWHSDYDVDTSFRFEVYVGEDEDSVKLMNETDFTSIEDAVKFARECIEESNLIAFIHEEVDEQGDKILTRHMI